MRTFLSAPRLKGPRLPSQDILLAFARRLAAAADAHAQDPSTGTAEAVIAARLELQEAFIRAGWIPPRYRQEEMQRDRRILHASAGVLDESFDSDEIGA